MAEEIAVVPAGRVEACILLIRGEKVILDSDLANLYGVTTKQLNQQVRRNRERFPEDFMFQLTWQEARALPQWPGSRSQIGTLKRGSNPKYRPHAFTEHGVIMAANVLNSERAVKVGIYIVRAFVKFRQMLTNYKELAQKIAELERRLGKHDQQILTLVDAIRRLAVEPPAPKRRQIGFRMEQDK
jgi:hypothetical protein